MDVSNLKELYLQSVSEGKFDDADIYLNKLKELKEIKELYLQSVSDGKFDDAESYLNKLKELKEKKELKDMEKMAEENKTGKIRRRTEEVFQWKKRCVSLILYYTLLR